MLNDDDGSNVGTAWISDPVIGTFSLFCVSET